jgi:hypothetical protein
MPCSFLMYLKNTSSSILDSVRKGMLTRIIRGNSTLTVNHNLNFSTLARRVSAANAICKDIGILTKS